MASVFTKRNYLKVVQGGSDASVKTAEPFTHKDIKEFLATFAEAILVDQERVNKLPRKKFHEYYDHGMWERNREDHVNALVDLSMTVDKMPKRLLKDLTELAITYESEFINEPLRNNISDLATRVSSPWLYETASLFFNELIKDVSRSGPSAPPKGTPVEIMLRWFDYDDPILIAQDSECDYVDLLASQLGRETEDKKRRLAARGRLSFIKKRVAKEFGDYVMSQYDALDED